jgi:hypothetical protein
MEPFTEATRLVFSATRKVARTSISENRSLMFNIWRSHMRAIHFLGT